MSLNTIVRGGVTYARTELNADGLPVEEGQEVTRWETTRVIEDKDEHERAVKTRSQARSLITKVCSATWFGLLCPTEQEGALDAAVVAARQIVDNFNATARHMRVGVYVIKGRVASNDEEAARAITAEIASLVKQMDAGIEAFDPESIRKAADRAREMTNMLSDEKQTKINAAIAQARKAAREIVKRIQKEGEDRTIVLKDIQRGQIESARIAFLDMSGESNDVVESTSPVQGQRFADLDAETPETRPSTATQDFAMRALEVEG